MIKKLIVKDFQAHKDTEIDFSDKVTSIIGINNQGKTSIFRALWKVIRDEPDGQIFIRNKPTLQQETTITLVTDLGSVTRIVRNDNSTRSNMYIVENSKLSKKPIEFAKFARTGIPEEVLLTLGISPIIDFGGVKYDINFSLQGDLLFLMQGQGLASIRGKVLGKIIQIDQGARAIQLVGGDEKKVNQDIKRLQGNIDTANIELKRYVKLDKLTSVWKSCKQVSDNCKSSEIFIEDLHQKSVAIGEIKQKALSLVKVRDTIEPYKFDKIIDNVNNLTNLISSLENVRDIKESIEIIEDFNLIYEGIKGVNFEEIGRLIKVISSSKKVLSLGRRLDVLKQIKEIDIPEVEELKSIEIIVKDLKAKVEVIDTKKTQIDIVETRLETIVPELESVVNELSQLKIELKVCPLCLRPFMEDMYSV